MCVCLIVYKTITNFYENTTKPTTDTKTEAGTKKDTNTDRQIKTDKDRHRQKHRQSFPSVGQRRPQKQTDDCGSVCTSPRRGWLVVRTWWWWWVDIGGVLIMAVGEKVGGNLGE